LVPLKHLFQPLRIGSMEVKNRIVMPGMEPGFGIDDDGCIHPQHTEFIVERARGEPGMIISGAMPVHPSGAADPATIRMVHLWQDNVWPGLQEMVRSVHRYEVKFGAQLNHAGLNRLPKESVCASVFPQLADMGMPLHEATREELKEFVEAFGKAAERCVEVGFDFIEIHGAHSYLINEFLTPHYNTRTDEYGGSFENRIRFLLDILRQVRSRVGDGIPLGVRLPGDDFISEGGWHIDDLCQLAPILEREGVNYINVSQAGAAYGSLHVNIAPIYEKQGAFTHFASEVKKHVSIPVATVGRIKSPVMADALVKDGKADLVAMGRALMADADMVAKARRGDISDIRFCLAECLGCIEGILRYGEASCAVNPRVGREYTLNDIEGEKKDTPKKILVAGAGCAGLEAARRAAFAGHRVLLCERRGWMGGQLRLAACIPEREEIADIIPWYERQLNKLNVEIRLNTAVDEGLLEKFNPDALIAATGSFPEVPLGYVDGLGNIEDIELIMVDDLIDEQKLTGETVLVIGGNQIGLQVADYLAERGKSVYLIEKGPKWAVEMARADRRYLIGRLIDREVVRHRGVERIEIKPVDDVWMSGAGGRERLPAIETIVLASQRRPDISLAEVAEKKGIETHIVGDAAGVSGEGQGTIMAAIASGYEVGRTV
jgi:2,4-dienoyl-CoA reductase-like NADH-dependent reductase (Old Yellow Enzyme family)/thioredoxin reductase